MRSPMAHPSRSGGSCGEIEEIDDVVPGRAKAVVVVDDVYVAVGKGSSSIVALSWALMHAATKPSSFVYLVHVFPPVHHIPTPCESAVPSSSLLLLILLVQRLPLLLFLFRQSHLLPTKSSDQTVKAVMELIPVLDIKRLIVGTSKSNLR
ncbi:hypothetical protein BHE74_00003281 [Ensete ventricosum]|nr:hypothetical protein BHE74_00003281 [Ensete ventricosum]